MVKKTKVKTSVIITGMICLTTLGCYALYRGVDHILLASISAAIAYLGGWVTPAPKNV